MSDQIETGSPSDYQKGYRAALTDAKDPALGKDVVIEAARDSKKLSTFAAGYRAGAAWISREGAP